MRVWAELGRTRIPLGAAPELPPGAVLELDRKADDPVDLYVNGLRFGSGRLVLTDEGEWAVRLDEVAGRRPTRHHRRRSDLMARVLVVDDAAFMRKMLTDALTAGGHEVVGEAGDGDAALAAYQDAAARTS